MGKASANTAMATSAIFFVGTSTFCGTKSALGAIVVCGGDSHVPVSSYSQDSGVPGFP